MVSILTITQPAVALVAPAPHRPVRLEQEGGALAGGHHRPRRFSREGRARRRARALGSSVVPATDDEREGQKHARDRAGRGATGASCPAWREGGERVGHVDLVLWSTARPGE